MGTTVNIRMRFSAGGTAPLVLTRSVPATLAGGETDVTCVQMATMEPSALRSAPGERQTPAVEMEPVARTPVFATVTLALGAMIAGAVTPATDLAQPQEGPTAVASLVTEGAGVISMG